MLGEKLMRLRKKQGYSQQEVADKLSVSRQTISNWECDQALPAVDKAMELAQLYNISLDDLMENEINYVKNIYGEVDSLKTKGIIDEVIKFMQYNANTALTNLGYEPKYDVKENDINPIVLNGLSTETKTHDFFSTKGNGYQKGKYEELTDEDFII